MYTNTARIFVFTAGVMLLGIGLVEILGNQGRELIQPADAAFKMSTRSLFWSVAALEILAALICIFSNSIRFPCMVVLWLSLNLFIYRGYTLYLGVHDISAYFETMATCFGVSAKAASGAMGVGMGYLLVGSCVSLLLLRREQKVLKLESGSH